MKRNQLLMIMVLLPLFLFINENSSWAATSSLETLTPNTYEEQEFKENTDYLNEKALYEQKKSIPEVQKKLTFEKPTSDSKEASLKKKLFDGRVDNTVSTQAKKMKLFTGEKQESFQLTDQKTSSSNSHIKVTIVLMVLLVIGLLAMVVLLIPKMIKGNKEFK